MNENARLLLELLSSKGLTLSSVESLTGGLFGKTITDVPGASCVYLGGAVTYSAKLKVELGVRQSTIDRFGVVSAEVAVEEGGKPVGCVYLGLVYRGSAWTIPLQFGGDRNDIRESTIEAMIAFIASLFPKEKESI